MVTVSFMNGADLTEVAFIMNQDYLKSGLREVLHSYGKLKIWAMVILHQLLLMMLFM